MNTLTRLFSALALISTPCIAAEKMPEDIDWYQVEVMIFSQQDLFNEERHITDIALSYPENIRELVDPAVTAKLAADSLPAHTLPIGIDTAPLTEETSSIENAPAIKSTTSTEEPFLILPEESLGMTPDHNRLKQAPGYRILYHKAWRQPGLGRTESPWILIKGGDIFGNHHELEGSFRLVRNRYLHIQADLWKTRFKEPRAKINSNRLSESAAIPNLHPQTQALTNSSLWPALPNAPQLEDRPIKNHPLENPSINEGTESNTLKPRIEKRFEAEYPFDPAYPIADIVTLEQSTRVSRDEPTYLDHPEMGVIVLVSKYELQEESNEAP